MEHNNQLAIAALRTLLADAADLPPSPEIAHAQAELGRALMLSGASEEAISWCDRVLANPASATTSVLVEAVITKGTALTTLGRVIESEALLRGAIAIADSNALLAASLRARNNLRVLLAYINLADALALNVEVRDIARKFGDRSWVLQAVGGSLDVCLRTGDWDAFAEDVAVEAGDTTGFYWSWFRAEDASREAYRGDPRRAEAVIDETLASGIIASSGQAVARNLAAKADAQIAQGRFAEAIETAAPGATLSAESEFPQLSRIFAATAVGDSALVAVVAEELRKQGFDQLPSGRGYIAVAAALVAALEGRWDDARRHQQEAEEPLLEVGEGLVNARFGLALGHLAGDRFPEAKRAGEDAEHWFTERGAGAYVAAYRAAAVAAGMGVAPAAVGGESRQERTTSVRATG
jgi:tetratricopeptide (TPR) repeat protein